MKKEEKQKKKKKEKKEKEKKRKRRRGRRIKRKKKKKKKKKKWRKKREKWRKRDREKRDEFPSSGGGKDLFPPAIFIMSKRQFGRPSTPARAGPTGNREGKGGVLCGGWRTKLSRKERKPWGMELTKNGEISSDILDHNDLPLE